MCYLNCGTRAEEVCQRHVHFMYIFIRIVTMGICRRKRCLSFSARICISAEVRHISGNNYSK